MSIVMINGKGFDIGHDKMSLEGKQVLMNNIADKSCPNKFIMSAPAWKDFSKSQQQEFSLKAMMNGLSISAPGYEYTITTLTQIKAKVIRQVFYELPPSDFMPVVLGEGAFMTNLVYNQIYSNADDFETGNIASAMPFGKVPTSNAQIIAKAQPIQPWAKGLNYNVFQLAQAAQGNVNLLEELEVTRKRNWDLGLQRVAFQGSRSVAGINGLYNGESILADTTFMTKTISAMTADEFQAFVSGLIAKYIANTAGTVMPNSLIIPLSDWVGLEGASSATFPISSKIEYMEKAFKRVTQQPGFKITTAKYGDKNQMNLIGSNHDRYVLYRNEPDALEFNVPMPYTTTTFGTANGWDFENVSYGQYSGVYFKHPLECIYFDNLNS